MILMRFLSYGQYINIIHTHHRGLKSKGLIVPLGKDVPGANLELLLPSSLVVLQLVRLQIDHIIKHDQRIM